MKLNRLDWIKIILRAVKYAGGAIGATAAFIEGYPILAPVSLVVAGIASETLDFIKEKEYKK
jgi:hypothetical protein